MEIQPDGSKQQPVEVTPLIDEKTPPREPSASDDSLDFSDEAVKPESAIQKPLEYDPRPIEDGARRNIAYALIAILGFLIIAIIELLWSNKINLTDLKEFAVILGPIITLVSAATGFYYGTK